MWYPPTVVVPFFESRSVTYEDRSAIAKWHFIPFDQRAVDEMTGELHIKFKAKPFTDSTG